MPCSGHNPSYNNVWKPAIDNIWGSGCTDGDLCIRFASEDLRQPIMRDNALDEAIFRTHVEKHRLDDWLMAAETAAVQSINEERQAERQAQLQQLVNAGEAEVVATQQVEESVEESVEVIEVASEENFLGDDEDSVAEGVEDVEMQDS